MTVRLGPAYPLGPVSFTGNHALGTDELDPMFRHGDWITLWNTPVPFTQKQLREDMDALTKRYRELGFRAGVRVTHRLQRPEEHRPRRQERPPRSRRRSRADSVELVLNVDDAGWRFLERDGDPLALVDGDADADVLGAAIDALLDAEVGGAPGTPANPSAR